MIRLMKKELMQIDKYLAREWAELELYKYQRILRTKHVAYLKNKMDKGEFLEGDIVFAEENKNIFLLNGQHQIWAFLGSKSKSLPILYRKYKCDNGLEVASLYRRFDSNKVRSQAECLYVEVRERGIQWPRKVIGLVGAGMTMVANKRDATRDDRIKLLESYIKEGDFIDAIFKSSQQCKHMARTPVIYAIMKTFQKSSIDADIFWINVRDGEKISTRHPAYKLREYLKDVRVYRGRGATLYPNVGLRIATDHEIAAKCITAWNAFRNGGSTALKYYIHKPIPEAI